MNDGKIYVACRETSTRYPKSLRTWRSRSIFLCLLFFFNILYFNCYCQINKSGNTVIFGVECSVGIFSGDTSRPTTERKWPIIQGTDRVFTSGHSCISDSASGTIKIICNGYRLFDTLGNIMDNGDSLVPPKIFTHNSIPDAPTTQGSIILPKGSNGLYYVFVATTTDSAYDYWIANGTEAPYNILQYLNIDIYRYIYTYISQYDIIYYST